MLFCRGFTFQNQKLQQRFLTAYAQNMFLLIPRRSTDKQSVAAMSKDVKQDVNGGREQEVGSLANTDVIMRSFKYLKNLHCSCD